MFKGRGWKDLKRDICRSAYDCGYQLSSNGPYGKQLNLRQFVCGYGCVCQTRNEPNSVLCSIVHKQDVEMNSRKIYNQENGTSLPRRRIVVRPMTNNKLCKFRLVVYVDASSFGILVRCGNKCHNGHPKIQSKCMRLPKRLLSAHEEK